LIFELIILAGDYTAFLLSQGIPLVGSVRKVRWNLGKRWDATAEAAGRYVGNVNMASYARAGYGRPILSLGKRMGCGCDSPTRLTTRDARAHRCQRLPARRKSIGRVGYGGKCLAVDRWICRWAHAAAVVRGGSYYQPL